MSAVAIDTLLYANKLKTAGVPAPLAEAQAEALSEVMTTMMQETIATKRENIDMQQEFKHDINELRHELKEVENRLVVRIDRLETKIERLETKIDRFEGKMDSLEGKIIIRLGAMLAVGIAMLSTLLIILRVH